MKDYEKERLEEEYTPKRKTNLDEAKKLDQKCKLPVYIFTYTFGIIMALILGVGMCLAMKVIGDGSTISLVGGIIIGLIGIAGVTVNYPLYNLFLKKRKEKYGVLILKTLNQE